MSESDINLFAIAFCPILIALALLLSLMMGWHIVIPIICILTAALFAYFSTILDSPTAALFFPLLIRPYLWSAACVIFIIYIVAR